MHQLTDTWSIPTIPKFSYRYHCARGVMIPVSIDYIAQQLYHEHQSFFHLHESKQLYKVCY